MAIRYLVHDENGTGHLPVSGEDGKPDHGLMGNAWAALHSGFRGNKYEGPDKEKALAALKELYKSEGMDLPSETNSAAAPESRAPSPESRLSAPRIYISFQLSTIGDAGTLRIPILVTGSWVKGGRDVSFTREELETAIANFQKLANHDLNVDYDHACEDLDRAGGEPTPSAGRITDLGPVEPYQIPDGPRAGQHCLMLWGSFEPTARARALIKNREYRYVSAAFAKDYPDRVTGEGQGLTLTSVALTNQPFLDELPELKLSISGDEIRGTGAGTRETGTAPPSHDSLSQAGAAKHIAQVLTEAVTTIVEGSKNHARQLAATEGRKAMALQIKHSFAADNSHVHEVYDGDKKVGELDHDGLCKYAAAHCKDGMGLSATAARTGKLSDLAAADRIALEREFQSELFTELGVAGKEKTEVGNLLAVAINPPPAEITVLSSAISGDGKLSEAQLNTLFDTGKIDRKAWRRAQEADARVARALNAGQLTPAMIATGFPLKCALSDVKMFEALVEGRPNIVNLNKVMGMGGSGNESGKSPRELFSDMVKERKEKLMQQEPRLGELDAQRRAASLIAKENPDLLKNYRADSKTM